MTTANGGSTQAPAAGQEKVPQFNVLAQYIKDFSFENPNAPRSLMNAQQPQINIKINVNANPMAEPSSTSFLHIEGKAESKEGLCSDSIFPMAAFSAS